MSWQSALGTLCVGVGGLAVAAVALLIFFQEKIIYVPVVPGLTREYPYTPERFRMLFEDVWLRASDGVKLHGWLLKWRADTTKVPTVLFFQENAGNIAHRLESVRYMMERLHCNVFLLSYRGYGASEGTPTEKGIRLDSQAALDHLRQRSDIDTSRIVVFGRSLGGAVGASLVARNQDKIAALVLENTFTSILDMAGVMLPFLRHAISSRGFRPLNVFVRSQWRTIDIVHKINVPMLLFVGAIDELVPPSHMHALHAQALTNERGTCVFVEIPNGGHMDTWMRGGDRYWRTLELFMQQHADGRFRGTGRRLLD